MSAKLYIIATPIGNLGDTSVRALDTLRSVDVIACEDTRKTRRLLSHFNIPQSFLISYHEHNKITAGRNIIQLILDGKNVALVSDAGTPGISDPGFRVIREAINTGIECEHIPGPSAIISALVLSGLPTDKFIFEGFLLPKSFGRRKKLAALKGEERTIIFYESPHRLLKTLDDMLAVLGDVRISVSRELTKKFEETRRGKVSDVLDYFKKKGVKGEFTLVVSQKV